MPTADDQNAAATAPEDRNNSRILTSDARTTGIKVFGLHLHIFGCITSIDTTINGMRIRRNNNYSKCIYLVYLVGGEAEGAVNNNRGGT